MEKIERRGGYRPGAGRPKSIRDEKLRVSTTIWLSPATRTMTRAMRKGGVDVSREIEAFLIRKYKKFAKDNGHEEE